MSDLQVISMNGEELKTIPLRLVAICNLLRVQENHNFTRAEICNRLGYGKTTHMINLIELGYARGYYGRSEFVASNGCLAYFYYWLDLPF